MISVGPISYVEKKLIFIINKIAVNKIKYDL